MKPLTVVIYKLAEKFSGSTTCLLEPIHMQLYICACVSTCMASVWQNPQHDILYEHFWLTAVVEHFEQIMAHYKLAL